MAKFIVGFRTTNNLTTTLLGKYTKIKLYSSRNYAEKKSEPPSKAKSSSKSAKRHGDRNPVDQHFKHAEAAKQMRWGRICIKSPRRSEYKCDPPFAQMGHWLTNPDCKSDPCEGVFPPFDKLYYKPTNKAKRRYQQTWSECPNLVVEPAAICRYEIIDAIPMKKRTLAEIKALTKGGNEQSKELAKNPENVCPKMKLPSCKPVRSDLKCKRPRIALDCEKPKCPYPSFSECQRAKIPKSKRVECACLTVDSMCEVYAEMRRQKILSKH